jgi:hypothetical protein
VHVTGDADPGQVTRLCHGLDNNPVSLVGVAVLDALELIALPAYVID